MTWPEHHPGVAPFFLAFLPQFVEPAAPSKAASFLFLGLVLNVNGLFVWLGLKLALSSEK